MNGIRFLFLFLLPFSTVFAQQSQNEIIEKYTSGYYSVYKLDDNKKFEKVGKSWPIEITKDAGKASKVLVKRSGILDEPFVPDVFGYPSHFFFKNYRLTFLNDYAAYYEWNAKQEVATKFVFVKEGDKLNDNLAAVNLAVQKYVVATFKNQGTAKSSQKEEQAKQDAVTQKANSLEGKEVAKIDIQIIEKPNEIAHFGKAIHYGIVATLKDGTQVKTKNLGGKLPWEDFRLHHVGCSNVPDIVNVENDAEKIPNDEIVFNVTSVFHPQLKATQSISTTNDVSIQVNRSGFRGLDRSDHQVVFQGVDGQHAGSAENLTVKVGTCKHKQTGAELYKIEIYSDTKKQIVGRYKLTPSTLLIINAKGGQGMDGRTGNKSSKVGGKGGDGGNGGSVTIIKDPSVGSLNITVNNQGGNGGKGGPPANKFDSNGPNGSRGSQGSSNTLTQKVTLNF